jgi:hypothetical protein
MCGIIAESTAGDQGAGKDDITNILRTLIFPTLLEIYQVLIRIRNLLYIDTMQGFLSSLFVYTKNYLKP